jgi:hypothetical protein
MIREPESTNPSWGTWDDAERWRHEAFQRRSPANRLAWLEDIWQLSRAAKSQREARAPHAAQDASASG